MKLLRERILGKLEASQQYPCISLLMRTHQQPRGYKSDRIRMKKLIAEMDRQLEQCAPARQARRLSRKMRNLVLTTDFRYLNKGLCLFVAGNVEEIQLLPREIEDRVVIGDVFAIKEILIDLHNNIDVFMVVISDDCTRVLTNTNGPFTELAGEHGFPLWREEGPGMTERIISSTLASYAWFPGRTRGPAVRAPLPGAYTPEENSVQLERSKQFFRIVDAALAKVMSDRARMILCGTPHQTALFESICSNGEKIFARVNGNFTKNAENELREMADEETEKFRLSQSEKAVNSVLAYDSAPKTAFGMEAVWQLAQQKQINRLIIEERFRFPAIVDREHLIIKKAPDLDRSQDATEELVKRAHFSGAEIFVCCNNALKDYGHIAARFGF